MRSLFLSAVIAATVFILSTSGLGILLGNDDGFASIQLRELYRLLKAEGHDVLIVPPADNESGQGGRVAYSSMGTLGKASEFGLIPAGAPALGQDPNDSHIWYYNGTPAACTFIALDYVVPKFYSNRTFDLYAGGPNFGNNLGPFLYTFSGTMGGTYAAISRGIPGISFSGGNGEQRSYQWLNATTKSGSPDPATIQAQLAVDMITKLANSTKPGEPVLPLGYGISVNTPRISSFTDNSCVARPFIQTQLSGGAFTNRAVLNSNTITFTFGNLVGQGINVCINENCSLPGEQTILSSGCFSSISNFTVDYDASSGKSQTDIRRRLDGLAKYRKVTRREISDREAEMLSPRRHE